MDSHTWASPKWPMATKVAGSSTTMPAFFMPRNARNAPIPEVIANFKLSGRACTMALRTPITDRTMNSTPERNTAPSAVSHGTPIWPTTVKAKNAFSPIPGAWAKGKRAMRPITSEPRKAAMHVTMTSWLKTLSTPGMMIAAESTSGLTKMT